MLVNLRSLAKYVGFMDSEALILASIYPDRQLQFPDS